MRLPLSLLSQLFAWAATTSAFPAELFHQHEIEAARQEVEATSPLEPRQNTDVPVQFNVVVTTQWGESVQVVGSIPQLGNWDQTAALPLDAARYTDANHVWSATVILPAGTQVQYKYVLIGSDGSITWEGDPDHSFTVPSVGTGASIADVWQPGADATQPSTSPTSSTPTSSTRPPAATEPTCTHGPTSRGCWTGAFDIDTDFDRNWPVTGRTVSYDLTVTNTTLAPDGFRRRVLAVNGQYPGPTIYANWGDTIRVTVHNQLQDNGTSIHWHGMRMFHANGQDGVPGVTECPIAPGRSKTYTLTATQYGTSWYHSHFSSQYGDGILGPIVIYGPATADYDIDLGPLPISDWYYPTVGITSLRAMHQNALAPTADNGLINGTMVSTFGGSYSRTTLTPGRKHRLRIINTAVDGHFQFSLDGHTMTVIAADFVPIVPYNASWVFVGIGQRYDVIIDANQTPGSYWFRAQSQDVAGCGSNFQNGNIRAIFAYQGHEDETPSTIAAPNTQRCTDETNIVPHWNSYVPPANIPEFEQLDAAINQSTAADGTLTIYWQVNSTPLRVDWGNPTVSAIQENPAHSNWPRTAGVITLPDANRWTYWVITEGVGSPFTVNIPHPIHMHGHDFSVLGWGTSAWTDADRENLNYRNPPRRDVAMLPTNGWVAIAFETNNPGAWLMHCHIAWHADEGFAVQFIESQTEMLEINPLPQDFDSQCAAWKDYFPARAAYSQTDSGI